MLLNQSLSRGIGKTIRAIRLFLIAPARNPITKLESYLYLPYIEKNANILQFDRDINNVDIPMRICYHLVPEEFSQNSLYGISKTIKQYAGIQPKKKLLAPIEHGCYLDDSGAPDDDPFARAIITFSEFRKEVISKYTERKVLPIGPYIHYAELIDIEILKDYKKKLGKTLLFFPAHSTHLIKTSFNHLQAIEWLRRVAKDHQFESVLICFYWKDCRPEIVELYLNAGFHCTTAGHIYDWNFLNRLKSIIWLSDVTASNAIGTHIGYCIYMNRPHWLFEQQITCTADVLINIPLKIRVENGIKSYQERKTYQSISSHLTNLFRDISLSVTHDQYEACNYFWGFNCIKTAEEMKRELTPLIE